MIKPRSPASRAAGPARYGIINLTCDEEPYVFFDGIKREYYDRAGIPYCFLYNEPRDRPKKANDCIYISDCDSPQGIPVMLEKFIWSINALQERPEWKECDYWLRTNSSTFINLEVLGRYLDVLPRERCYAGSICAGKLISGTCIIFSKDVVRRLAGIRIERLPCIYDDLVIRKIMARSLIRMRDLPMRFFIDNAIHDVEEIRSALEEYPLIRVKNGDDRSRFDYDVWTKIATLKGLSRG